MTTTNANDSTAGTKRERRLALSFIFSAWSACASLHAKSLPPEIRELVVVGASLSILPDITSHASLRTHCPKIRVTLSPEPQALQAKQPSKQILMTLSAMPDPSIPRFNLKKRAIGSEVRERPAKGMTTFNSAFLNGIFQDVAKVQSSAPVSHEPPSSPQQEQPARKKSRLSSSLSRCGKSFHILNEALSTLETPQSSTTNLTAAAVSPMSRDNSLAYQLHCVGSDSDAVKANVFPLLPMDTTQTHHPLSRKVSEPELLATATAAKESYGWFIEMDDSSPTSENSTSSSTHSTSCTLHTNLAFRAHTAPKAVNHDAEVEWAKAADTVDDVLGDFF